MKNTEFLKTILSHKITPYIIVFFAAFAIYAQTLNFGLVNDDDYKLTISSSQNSAVTGAFQNDVFYGNMTVYFYRPLLAVSFIIDNKIAGTSVFHAHLTNVLLHCVCAMLVLFFCKKYLFGQEPGHWFGCLLPLLAALLFAVHPVTIQTVAWVAGRNDSILFIFFILCLIFFKEYLASKKTLFLGLHFIFLLFCLYTKEHALIIPFLLFCFYVLNKSQHGKMRGINCPSAEAPPLAESINYRPCDGAASPRNNFAECRVNNKEKNFQLPLPVYLLWLLALAVFLTSKYIALPNQTDGYSLSLSYQALAAFFDHISAVIFFRAPMAEHPETKIFILGIVSFLLILFFSVYKQPFSQIKRNMFYVIAIIAFLLPDFISGEPFSGRTTFQGNRLYVPLFCIIVIFFSFFETVIRANLKFKKILYVFTAALIILSSYITVVNSKAYQDDLTLWSRVFTESKMIKLLPVTFYIDALINHGLYNEALEKASLFSKLTEYKNIAVLSRLARTHEILGDDEKARYYASLVKQLLIERQTDLP